MPSVTSERILSFSSRSASDSARPEQRELEARLDIGRLQQLHTLLHRELGHVRGHVGELAGVVDPREHVGHAAGAAVLEDGLDHGPVLLGELTGTRGRLGIDEGLDLHVEGALRCRSHRCRSAPG